MDYKIGVKRIQAAGYNGAGTVTNCPLLNGNMQRETDTETPLPPKKRRDYLFIMISRGWMVSVKRLTINQHFLEPRHPVKISKTLVVVLTFFHQVDTAGISSFFFFILFFSSFQSMLVSFFTGKKNLLPDIRNIRKRMTTFIFTRVCKCIFCKLIFLVETILLSFQSTIAIFGFFCRKSI